MDEIIEKIFELVIKKMKEQGGYDHEAYGEYIDETIAYYQTKGKLTDEDSEEFIRNELLHRWNEAQSELSSEKK